LIRLVSNVKRKRNRKQEEKVDCAYEVKSMVEIADGTRRGWLGWRIGRLCS
jgi:hypothetical protein